MSVYINQYKCSFSKKDIYDTQPEKDIPNRSKFTQFTLVTYLQTKTYITDLRILSAYANRLHNIKHIFAYV